MNKQEKIVVDPHLKKEINEEGFDENAAVLIGKKEDMPQLEEKLEKEGKAENLGTYIKLHKEIVLPNSEITDEKLKRGISDNKGKFFFSRSYKEKDADFTYFLTYIDKDSNIAKVNILVESITELKKEIDQLRNKYQCFENILRQDIQQIVEERIKDTGFIISESEEDSRLWNQIFDNMNKYKERLEKESKEIKEFDF